MPQIPAATAVTAIAHSCNFAMLSHKGRLRHTNQDTCAARPEHGAFVVCDGMGGAAGGEVASRLATETFLDCLTHPCSTQPGPATRARLADAIRVANQTVFRRSHLSPSLHGMGTTLVAIMWEEVVQLIEVAQPPREDTLASPTPKLWLAHVGDSRCYLFRSGTLRLLTQDHSLVEEQVRAGVLSRVQAAASPMRSIITRAIGTQPTVQADIACHAALPGDLYMLATDGLTRELEDDIIAQVLSRTVNPAMHAVGRNSARSTSAGNDSATAGMALLSALDSTCQALVDAANAKGGHDNITVLLVEVPYRPDSPRE